MEILTDSPRVRQARRVVLELLQSSVDTSTAPDCSGLPRLRGAAGSLRPGRARRATLGRTTIELYVRDYGKCILCYKCVQACGEEAQFTFAIGVAGRGFTAHIDTA